MVVSSVNASSGLPGRRSISRPAWPSAGAIQLHGRPRTTSVGEFDIDALGTGLGDRLQLGSSGGEVPITTTQRVVQRPTMFSTAWRKVTSKSLVGRARRPHLNSMAAPPLSTNSGSRFSSLAWLLGKPSTASTLLAAERTADTRSCNAKRFRRLRRGICATPSKRVRSCRHRPHECPDGDFLGAASGDYVDMSDRASGLDKAPPCQPKALWDRRAISVAGAGGAVPMETYAVSSGQLRGGDCRGGRPRGSWQGRCLRSMQWRRSRGYRVGCQ